MPQSFKKLGKAFEELVGSVFQVFHPNAEISIGEWIDGPDGQREVDVTIRANFEGGERLVIIECKDHSTAKRPVGISEVDAFESKSRDLGADAALMCSNTRFSSGALSKASRFGIGMVSMASAGNPIARAEFVETHLMRAIFIPGMAISSSNRWTATPERR